MSVVPHLRLFLKDTIMASSVIPADKARIKLFKEMTPATQKLAEEFENKIGHAASNVILTQHILGARISAIMDDEATYGSNAIEQLATYLQMPGGTTYLYALKTFADTFTRDYVKQKSAQLMSNKSTLTVAHWLHLTKIHDDKARENMLTRVLAESLTSNDLEKEIRAGTAGSVKNTRQGGRKPKMPTNPLVGLQRVCALSNKFVRFESAASTAVFDALDALPADRVTDSALARTEATLVQVKNTIEKAQAMRERLEKSISRMKKVHGQAEPEKTEETAKPAASQEMATRKKKKK